MKAAIYGLVRGEETLEAGQIMFQLSLSSRPSFLERVKDASELFQDDLCPMFSIEPMHNLHLRISKLLKDWFLVHAGFRA